MLDEVLIGVIAGIVIAIIGVIAFFGIIVICVIIYVSILEILSSIEKLIPILSKYFQKEKS